MKSISKDGVKEFSSGVSQKLNRFVDPLLRRWIESDSVVLVLSLLFACIAWFAVAYTEDERITDIITGVPVHFDSAASSISRLGLYPVIDGELSVDVEISGPRATVGNITADDIRAEAKFNNVTGPGTYDVALEVSDYMGRSYDVNSVRPETLTVRFDRQRTRTIDIDLEFEGLEIPDGYILDAEYLYPNKVTVSGPETEVLSIAECRAKLVFDEPLLVTNTREVELVLYDALGNVVESSFVTMDNKTASVTLPVLKKKVVPITFDFVNIPEGFDVNTLGFEITPEEIEIAGPEENIGSVSEVHLGYIDLSDFTPEEPFVYTVELPTGYIAVDNTQEATITFEAEDYTTAVLNISRINLINRPDDYDVVVATKMIYGVTVCGPAEDIEKLKNDDLVAEIDMHEVDMRVGQSTVDVSVLIPSYPSCWAYGDTYTAVITARAK